MSVGRAELAIKFDVLWKRATDEVARAKCRRSGRRRMRCTAFSAYLDGDVVWRARGTVTAHDIRQGAYVLRYVLKGTKKVCPYNESCTTSRFTWRGSRPVAYPWVQD